MKALIRPYSVFLIALLAACGQISQSGDGQVEQAFKTKATDVQVAGEGLIFRTLSDDRSGSPHQRFILRLASGQTVLIQHNIDVAPRINDLKTGDTVSFYGEYIWNDQGGLIHWTHHDPAGRHTGGWVKHNGRTYQ